MKPAGPVAEFADLSMKDKVERSVELERFDAKNLQAIKDDEIILLDFSFMLIKLHKYDPSTVADDR